MQITSVFKDNEYVPKQYTCEGSNINPPLEFKDVPSNAKSLVLIIDDPDAPIGTWIHWIVFNIPPATTKVEENSIPEGGTEGIANGGTHGYEGPCPPSGTHHYYFKLYALDTTLNLSDSADKKQLEETMKGHVIEQAQLIGLYDKAVRLKPL